MSDITCPIVAIGASAGGLVALKAFFKVMPSDAGAAYVVIQHLEPQHKSLTAEILSRITTMPTQQITNGMQVNVNHVYVIPPNTYLTLEHDVFTLSKPTLRHGLRLPIDAFYESLAQQHQQRSIAIIVSGTGCDGTVGLKSIKEKGGLAIAQSPESAEYAGMPQCAIDSGLIDIECLIEEMPAHLIGYLQHPYIHQYDHVGQQTQDKDASHLSRILALLQSRTGHDFKVYKQGTLDRRITRRMSLHRIKSVSKYLEFLRSHDQEVSQLFRDLLIGVTAFFRDADAFLALEKHVIDPIVAAKKEDEAIRVWIPGCSTGEEAYSIAILLFEKLEQANKHCVIQIFASDIDERALTVARAGVYPENVFTSFAPKRLNRFFSKQDHSYRVNKILRDSVTFATQNIVSDPPFSNLDFVSCRNLLIYLNADIQRKVLALFHFALKDNGNLFLGHSETCSQQSDLFKPLNKKWRIYQRLNTTKAKGLDFPIGSRPIGLEQTNLPVRKSSREQLDFSDITQTHLLQEFAPAAVLVDQKYQVLHFYGPTSRYLEQPTGAPTQDILTLVKKELRAKLRVALRRVSTENNRIIVDDIYMLHDGTKTNVCLMLKPIHSRRYSSTLILITFEIRSEQQAIESTKSETAIDADKTLIQQIEDELYITREDLQSNIEELESANEELQAANEEVMSVNEELQSSNEELESSKEELQSMNEELTTVNSQYKDKVDELAKSHDDISNLLSSTEIATIFVDSEMKIGRFTPATKELLNLISTDVGRPLADIRLKFDDGKLLDEVQHVMDKLTPFESEIVSESGEYYLKRILPYRTSDNHINGVVISFINISQRKRAEMRNQRLATILKDSNDAVISIDPDGNILAWNRSAVEMYGWNETEALTLNIRDLVPVEELKNIQSLIRSARAGKTLKSFDCRRLTKKGRQLDVWMTLTPLFDSKGTLKELASTERDISQRKQRESILAANESNFRALIESAPDALIISNEKGQIEITNKQAEDLFGYNKYELLDMTIEQLMPTRFREKHLADRLKYNKNPQVRVVGNGLEVFGLTKAGIEIPLEISLSPIESDHGQLVSAAIRDITARKESEKALQKAKLQADSALSAKSRFLATASHDLRQPLYSLTLLNRALQNQLKDPALLDIVKMQNQSLTSMSQLLNSLLDISKLESGGITAKFTVFSLQSLLESFTSQFSKEAAEKGLELRLVATDELVFSDQDIVKQLLQNLVSNAIRYTPAGSIKITCVRQKNRLKVSVIDTGIGIPKHEFESIFEEFHQVNRNTQERHGGLGLGLAIVKRLAALLETDIELESEVGQGSVFSFYLPVARANEKRVDSSNAAPTDPMISDSVVLLIDDDPAVLDASETLLSTESKLDIKPAICPAQAYSIVDSIKPDLIITDYHLVDKETGVDVIRNIRKKFKDAIPAIIVTGDTTLQTDFIENENIITLIKPIEPSTLISHVKRSLSGRAPAANVSKEKP